MREVVLIVAAFFVGVVTMRIWRSYRRRQTVSEMLESFADEHLLDYKTDWWWSDQRVTGEYRGAFVELSTAGWPLDYSTVGIHYQVRLPETIPPDLSLYHDDDRGFPLRNVRDVPTADIAAETIGSDWNVMTEHRERARRLLADDQLGRVMQSKKRAGRFAGIVRRSAKGGGVIPVRGKASLQTQLDALVDLHDAFAEATPRGRDGEP